MATMSKAMKEAQQLSIKYGCWYVRRIGDGLNFAAYAHSSDDERTVACYINGKLFDEQQEQQEQARRDFAQINGNDSGFDPYRFVE